MVAKANSHGPNSGHGRRPALDEPTKMHLLELWGGGFLNREPTQVADPRRHKEVAIPNGFLPKAGEKPKVFYFKGIPTNGTIQAGSTRLREGEGLQYIRVHPDRLEIGRTSGKGITSWARDVPIERRNGHHVGRVTGSMGSTSSLVRFSLEQGRSC